MSSSWSLCWEVLNLVVSETIQPAIMRIDERETGINVIINMSSSDKT